MEHIQKIQELVDSFLDKLGRDDITVEADYDIGMLCYHEMREVMFDLNYYEPYHERPFKKAVKKWYNRNGYKFDIHIATFGLLHELGHLIAQDEYDNWEEEYAQYDLALNFLGRITLKKYKKLKMERDADRAGYEIYKTMTKQVRQLDREIKRILKNSQ